MPNAVAASGRLLRSSRREQGWEDWGSQPRIAGTEPAHVFAPIVCSPRHVEVVVSLEWCLKQDSLRASARFFSMVSYGLFRVRSCLALSQLFRQLLAKFTGRLNGVTTSYEYTQAGKP